MWLVTTSGFFSVIEWHDGRMAIRARRRVDLTRLKKLVPDVKFEGDLKPTPSKDYRYRLFCSRSEWVDKVLPALGREVTYGNFKSELDRRYGLKDALGRAAHQAWGVFARMQPAGPYGTGGAGYPKVPKGEKKIQGAHERLRRSWFPTETRRLDDDEMLECVECGAALLPEQTDVIAGEAYCKDVGACVATKSGTFR
jgi:hypothetical protein